MPSAACLDQAPSSRTTTLASILDAELRESIRLDILEITDSAQRSALEAALSAGHLRRDTVTDPKELSRYAELRQARRPASRSRRLAGGLSRRTTNGVFAAK